MEKYFVYCPESGFEKFSTIEARDKYAKECIAAFLDEGWDESVEQVVVGEITHQATQTNRVDKPADLDRDGCGPDGEYWNPEFEYTCEYELQPLATKSQ